MDSPARKRPSISGPDAKPASRGRSSAKLNDQLALPLSEQERKASRKQLDKLHPGNRFRLMFGQPLLPEETGEGESK